MSKVTVFNSGNADITLNVFTVDPKFDDGRGSAEARTIPGRRPDPQDVNKTIGGAFDIEESFLEQAMKIPVVKMLFSDEHAPAKLRIKGGWQPRSTVAASNQKSSGAR